MRSSARALTHHPILAVDMNIRDGLGKVVYQFSWTVSRIASESAPMQRRMAPEIGDRYMPAGTA